MIGWQSFNLTIGRKNLYYQPPRSLAFSQSIATNGSGPCKPSGSSHLVGGPAALWTIGHASGCRSITASTEDLPITTRQDATVNAFSLHGGAGIKCGALACCGSRFEPVRFVVSSRYEFFAAEIPNAKSRAAYAPAAGDFRTWCEQQDV